VFGSTAFDCDVVTVLDSARDKMSWVPGVLEFIWVVQVYHGYPLARAALVNTVDYVALARTGPRCRLGQAVQSGGTRKFSGSRVVIPGLKVRVRRASEDHVALEAFRAIGS
jgi:hypothetical protein